MNGAPAFSSALGVNAGVMLFCLALALLLLGHVMRLARWSLLMRQMGHPRLGEGFLALCLGYLVNAIVPLRLGELVRASYYARRLKADFAFVLATVVVERTLDLLAVWAATMVLVAVGVFGGVSVVWETVLTAGTALLLVLLVFGTSRSRAVRQAVWTVTLVFNPRIQTVLLDLLWSMLEVVRDARARWVRILLQSVAMWGLYALSFVLLAQALGIGVQGVFRATVASPLLPMIVPLVREGGTAAAGLVAFSFAPVLLFLVYVGAKQQFGVSAWGAVSWMQDPALYRDSAPRTRTRFVEREHYGDFLARRFRNEAGLVAEFEHHAIRDIVVQRMLRGGSDALTVMVQLGNQLSIRKYASGHAAAKLQNQCDWLRRCSNRLPAVRIKDQQRNGQNFHYDMEYSGTSRDLFDWVHTYDVDASWRVLSDVLDTMAAFHADTQAGDADAACTARYATEKVSTNLSAIKAAVPELFRQETIEVNGLPFRLDMLDRFAAPGFVDRRITRRGTATIHGDLTIENILTDPARPAGWFLIDPNVGNVFESPLLDYAKIMQSLHLGYESLNRELSCSFDGHALAFPNARSAQYAALHDKAVGWIRDRFGEDGLREVRLHEVVHYFRLTPYKFRKGLEPGLVFLGCLCLLVRRYMDEFEPC